MLVIKNPQALHEIRHNAIQALFAFKYSTGLHSVARTARQRINTRYSELVKESLKTTNNYTRNLNTVILVEDFKQYVNEILQVIK